MILFDWIEEHPFKLVLCIVSVLMIWHQYEFGYKSNKHQHHLKDIEKRKKNGHKKL